MPVQVKHLSKTPARIWCSSESVDATARLPLRSTHATEATCLRCLQMACVEFEREWYAAKYYTPNAEAKCYACDAPAIGLAANGRGPACDRHAEKAGAA